MGDMSRGIHVTKRWGCGGKWHPGAVVMDEELCAS